LPKEGSFGASWSGRLIAISTLISILLLAIATFTLASGRGGEFFGAVVPIAILVGSGLTMIRGYAITDEHIAIKRLIWSTYIGRHDLEGARVVELDRYGGWRVAGNGGLFSFSGIFQNEQLGRYRAFSTGGTRGVVLDYPSRRIFLTPDDPERFVRALTDHASA